jgi:class 3 adenylate cyclase
MLAKSFGRLSFLILAVAFFASTASAETLALDKRGVYFPDSAIETLVDKGGTLSVADMEKPEVSSAFRPAQWIGWTNKAVWYRLTVNNPSDLPKALRLQIFHPWITSVEFYAPTTLGGHNVVRAGSGLPRASWEVDSPLPTFSFLAPANKGSTVYLRAFSENLFQVPFVLLSEEAFEKSELYGNFFIALFVGAAIAMLVYNFLLYASLRDKAYLWFVLYIASMTLLVLSLKGFAFQYLWPESPVWGGRFNHLFGSLVQITGVLFTRYFLATEKQNPALDRVLKLYAYAHLVYIPLVYPWPSALFAPASAFTEASPLIFDFLLLYTGLASLNRGNRAARFFVISSAFTIFGMAVFILGVLGVFPYGYFADNAMEGGFFLEIVVLSLALADRMKIMREEKEKAESETRAVLQKSNEELEERVKERTLEIAEANIKLLDLSNTLKIRNEFIKKTFGRYMSNEVVEKLLESPDGLKLGGDSLMVTVVMADLRGFSAISEELSPENVVEMLNMYLGEMTDVVNKHSGTAIIEIIGDAVMVLFGAPTTRPDDADRALACALGMQLGMVTLNQKLRGKNLPELEIGIGIHTGKVVAGNVGSDTRAKYAVMGGNVNLACRVESFTVGGQIFITGETHNATSLELKIGGELLVPFKGFKQPIRVYELLGVAGKYNFSLPEEKLDFTPLASGMAVILEVLESKYSVGETGEGTIVAISGKSAELRTGMTLVELTNLKLKIVGENQNTVVENAYAKVRNSKNGMATIRFTYMPQELKKILEDSKIKP